MKKFYFWLPALLVFLLAGCVTVFVPVNTPTPAPTAIILPTLPPPTRSVVASPTAVSFAPICSADPLATACTPPVVETLDKTCVKKVPYTFVSLPTDATYEIVDAGLTCKDEGIHSGKQMISCTAQEQLYSYRLKVCASSCSADALLVTGSAQCAEGYGYNAAGGCCWPLPPADAGCILYKVEISACR